MNDHDGSLGGGPLDVQGSALSDQSAMSAAIRREQTVLPASWRADADRVTHDEPEIEAPGRNQVRLPRHWACRRSGA